MKRTVIVAVMLTLVSCTAGFWSASYYRIKNEKQPLIDSLEQVVGRLIELEMREKRIKEMEETLMIHYKLSWYESHYYSILFDDFSQKYDIPWQVYPAILRIESNFDPTLLSSKGARGMAQVMDATAKEVAEELGIEFVPKKTLWNDLINMVLGFEYLSKAIKERGLEEGIQVYIGGPGFNKGRKDIGDYRTTVRWEFDRLTYIHAGVVNGARIPYFSPDSTIQIAEVD